MIVAGEWTFHLAFAALMASAVWMGLSLGII